MPGDGDASSTSRLARLRRRPTGDLVALGLFLAYVVVALPAVLLRLGDYQWFMRDEWIFLSDENDPGHWLTPLNAHWVTLPRIAYGALWQVVGVTRYWPYQGLAVTLHLTIAVLLWVVIRRARASAWLASAAAAILVLFGPGSQNMVWAFQITMTGAVVFGLGHLLLSDHDGRWDRRDTLGLLCGILGLMCSGVAVTMVAIVVLAVLIRRGPWLAVAHGAPPAAIYLLWTVVQDPTTSSPFGRPTPAQALGWVGDGLDATLASMAAGWRPLEVVYGIAIVAGMVVAWAPWRRDDLPEARARLAAPTALLVGAVVFFGITTWGRYSPDRGQLIESSRYLHVGAALLIPALAVGADALARRWRPLLPVFVVLLLLPIPSNLDGFDGTFFGEAYNDQRLRILTTAPRFDFAREVPRDVQPVPDPFAGTGVTIGFLLDAVDDGRLVPSHHTITPTEENTFRIRLGLRQAPVPTGFHGCEVLPAPHDVQLAEGDTFRLTSMVAVAMVDDAGEIVSNTVDLNPANGNGVEAVAPFALSLRIWPAPAGADLVLCGLP